MNSYQSPCKASASPLHASGRKPSAFFLQIKKQPKARQHLQRMQKNLHTPIALSALTGLIAIGCDVPFVSLLLHLALS